MIEINYTEMTTNTLHTFRINNTQIMRNTGGQGWIVNHRVNHNNFIIKGLYIQRIRENLVNIYRNVHQNVHNHQGTFPKCLSYRSFPIGVGTWRSINANENGEVIIYRNLENFKTLSDIMRTTGNIHKFIRNKKLDPTEIAKDLLCGIFLLESSNVVHGDLTCSNIAFGYVQKRHPWFHIYDLEGSGIINNYEKQSTLKVIAAMDPYLLRPPKDSSDLYNWSKWIDVWLGLQIIGYIWSGILIFRWLKRISLRSIENLIRNNCIDLANWDWPPHIRQGNSTCRNLVNDLINTNEINMIARIWKRNVPLRFKQCLFNVFINGVANKNNVAPPMNFRNIVKAMGVNCYMGNRNGGN